MNIAEFAQRCGKSERTVRNWIGCGFIPGSSIEQDFVPEAAREPYTAARAKKGSALLRSVITAADHRKGIFPELFHITEEEFDALIGYLIQEGMIVEFEIDGIRYFDATDRGHDSLKLVKAPDWIQIGIAVAAWAPVLVPLFSK